MIASHQHKRTHSPEPMTIASYSNSFLGVDVNTVLCSLPIFAPVQVLYIGVKAVA
jgi:hypothetical protein